MPVDTSFYNTQPPPNIYAGLGSTVGLANGIVENRMLQNELQSRQAIGNAYQQSLNPDGTINVPQLDRSIAANPAAAYGAAQGYANSASLQGANLANQGAAVQQAQGRMNDFYSSMGPLLSAGGAPTREQVMGLAADLLHQGRLLPQDVVAINGELPLDDRQVPEYAQKKFGTALSAPQQAAQGPTVIDPATGQTFTPTEGQFVRSATAPNPNSVPGVATALPPGQGESILTNNAAFNNDLIKSNGTTANIRNLTTALPLLEQMGPGGAGPGSSQWNQLKSFLVTQGVITPDDTNVDVRQETQKYLHRYVSANPVAQRSDQAQNLSDSSSPNLDTSTKATIALAKSAIGFDRMDAAIPIAFAKTHPNPTQRSQYLAFKANFNQANDPRAFSFDLMSPTERQAVVKSLGSPSSAAYQKFRHSLETANSIGIVAPPEGSQ